MSRNKLFIVLLLSQIMLGSAKIWARGISYSNTKLVASGLITSSQDLAINFRLVSALDCSEYDCFAVPENQVCEFDLSWKANANLNNTYVISGVRLIEAKSEVALSCEQRMLNWIRNLDKNNSLAYELWRIENVEFVIAPDKKSISDSHCYKYHRVREQFFVNGAAYGASSKETQSGFDETDVVDDSYCR